MPDDLPHEEVLEIAMPYLGPFISQPVDWSPRLTHPHADRGTKKNGRPKKSRDDNNDDHEDWQFEQFLIAT